MDEVKTIARVDGTRGEIVLRQRGAGGGVVYELIVNGTFAMDSVETRSERALADVAVGGGAAGLRVLLGGLGLGYTAWEVLQHDVERVDVVEWEECIVEWARDGLTPILGRVAADPRATLYVGDIAAVLTGESGPNGPWDAILLDVDNGPDFLIHASNAALYTAPLLGAAYAQLAPGGTLAIWCQGVVPELLTACRAISPDVEEQLHRVRRGERHFAYAIYTLSRPAVRSGPQ